MANIYDIATIQARDPLGQQTEAHAEATARLEQYRHKKEIIAEINRAIKKAQEEANKPQRSTSKPGQNPFSSK